MSMLEVDAPALQVGDQVELAAPVAHVRRPVGTRGVVLVSGLPFGACSVSFDRVADPADRPPRQLYQVRAAHLRKVSL
jgi:hypothetical protein